MNTSQLNKVFFKDTAFWLALIAGPVVWCALLLLGRGTGTPTVDWLLLAKLVLLYPILEEIVFRGGVQTFLLERKALTKHIFGISLANVLTSIAFAALHLIYQPVLWALLVFVPSLVFGWARERYGSVIPSILLHGFYNLGFVLLFVAM